MEQVLKWSLGIDVGARQLRVCLSSINHQQRVKVKASKKINNTAAGLSELLTWLHKNYKDKTLPLSVVMEATGVYYERCALRLQQEGYHVSVVLPTKAKRYLQAVGLKSKTDKIDAEGLSRMGAEQSLPAWSAQSAQLYGLRLLTRQHEDLQKSITSFSNQLHALQHGMYRYADIENTYTQTIAQLQALLQQVEKAIHQSITEDALLTEKVALLCSVKGVGELTAATLLSETNGFTLFENQRQLTSYAGYDVVENQSGNHRGKTKISKKGNAHIRRILHMAALTAVSRKVAPFEALYERVVARSGIKMKGLVAVQRKLLLLCYTLCKKKQSFQPPVAQIATREQEPVPSFGLALQKP